MSDPINWTQQRKRLGDLTPWPRNPRQIKTPQAKRLLASVQEFGQVETLAIGPDGEVYNGHQRLAVLMERYGPDYEVDVRVSSRPLSEKEREKLTVYLHKGAAGEWDFDVLANEFEIAELVEWGFDAAELGIDLTGGTDNDAEPQIDRAEELRQQWGVEPGQLWRLPSRTAGQEHRLICGDCTDAAVVDRVMGEGRATLAAVDPPYNVGFDYDGETVDDNKAAEVYERFSRAWFVLCQSVSDRQIVTPGCNNLAYWLRWFDAYHWAPWTKTNSMTNGRTSRFWCWEPILFFGGKWPRRRSNDVFDFPIGEQGGVANHPCPKPLKMWQDLIENYSAPSEMLYEAFSGSGTTIIAAENLSRQCRAVEISPAYVAVALQRYVDAFGIEPELVN